MPINLHGRSFLKLLDFTPAEIRFLLRLAGSLKEAKAAGTERQRLRGKTIALIFEKDSTRTRSGFEVAAFDQGAHVTYIGPSGSHIGHKETMKDTARVLGRFYDAIEYRGFAQADAETLAAFSGVPVYNGLTDDFHPTQVLADLLTMHEYTHGCTRAWSADQPAPASGENHRSTRCRPARPRMPPAFPHRLGQIPDTRLRRKTGPAPGQYPSWFPYGRYGCPTGRYT